jgi:endonuclease YncB( thermonuclease family)
VTNAVPTASVGDGSGGGMFGGGGGGGGRPPFDGDYDGEGGYRHITISNATIQGMTANSVGITLQGGSLVLNGQNVDVGQRGYSGFSSGSSQDPIVNAVVNRLALARTRASEQLAQVSDPAERAKLQKETMTAFAKVAFDALNTAIGSAGRKLIGSKGFAKDKGAFMDDPLGSLEQYSILSQKLYDSQAEEITQLSAKEFLPDVDKARLAELTQSNESLSRFINLIRELRTQLEYTSKAAQQSRPAYQPKDSSSRTSGNSPTTVNNVAGRRDRFMQTALQAERNLFDQTLGSVGGAYGADGRASLVAATREYVMKTLSSSNLVNKSVNASTGLAQIDSTLGFDVTDPDLVASGVDFSEINSTIDRITLSLRQFDQASDIESSVSSFSQLNVALQEARDSLMTLANDPTLDPAVRDQVLKRVQTIDESQYGTSDGMRELDKTEKALTSQRSRQLGALREQLQANATRNYALGPFDPRRGMRERQFIESYLRSTLNEAGVKTLTDSGTLRAISAADPKGRVDFRTATYEDLAATSKALSASGSEMSIESLTGLQKVLNDTEQQKNESPFSQRFNWLMNRGRDLQTAGMYIQSAFNLPQTMTSLIQQFAEPQLNTVRTLTSARALSLDSSRYNQVLGAASNLQQRFGGTVTGQLGQITSFIPLTNTYGVDIDEVVNVARKLAAFDPAQGMEGASIAIKEFLSGNVASLSRRFELNRSELTKINTGDPEKMLDSLNNLLNGMGITDRLIDEQANSMATKYDKMLGKIEQIYINLSSVAVEQMTPYLDRLTNGTDGGLFGIDLSGFSKTKAFQTIAREQALGASDEIISGEKGLDSIDLYTSSLDFVENVDTVLRDANKAMGGVSATYAQLTGTPAGFDAYRLLGNMKLGERMRVQSAARENVGKGMTTSQAILQALRDVGGDYNSNQTMMGFRRELGFYNDIALSDSAQKELVQSLGESNYEGWSSLTEQVDVVEVKDADTIRIRTKSGELKDVRLAGIDAYEKSSPEGIAAANYLKSVLKVGSQISLSTRGQDMYGRAIGMVNANGVNINADLIRQGYAGAGYLGLSGFTPEMQMQFEQLQLAAANSGTGIINQDAAAVGLGAMPIISQEARDRAFEQQYGLGQFLTGGLAGAAGWMGGSAIASLALSGGWVPATAGLAPAGAGFGSSIVAGALNPAFFLPLLATVVAAGGGYAIKRGMDKQAFNEDTSAETQRLIMEKQLEIDTEDMNKKRGAKLAEASAKFITDQQVEQTRINQLANSSNPDALVGNAFLQLFDPETATTSANIQISKEQQLEFEKAVAAANTAYAERYGSMTDSQKAVEKILKRNPFTGEKDTIATIRKDIMAYQSASTTNEGAAKLLDENEQSIKEFNKTNDLLTGNIDSINQAIADGLEVDLSAFAGYQNIYKNTSQPLPKTVITKGLIENASSDVLQSILNQIPVERSNTYQQEAKNYIDQSMEKQMQLRQTRFNTMMDTGAQFAFTPMGSAMLREALMQEDLPIGAAMSGSRLERILPLNGVTADGAVKDLIDGIRQAEDTYIKIAEANKEQEAIVYSTNLAYGTTMRNFLASISDPADTGNQNFKTIMANMGQGDPRFMFDYIDRMMGINPMQMLQQGFTPNMPLTRNASGSVSFGYSQGPLGQIAQFTDILRSPLAGSSFNFGDTLNALEGLAQAQGQVTMRGIQFNNQMRDLTINHNRSLEDIARNNGRQLESIHRNYTRDMKIAQAANEVNKRADAPAVYENLISKKATLSPEVIQSINQRYVNDKNEANRLGVLNYEFLRENLGEEDPEFTALIDEYTAIDPSDYEAREKFFQERLRPAGEALKARVQAKYDAAEGPEKERYGTLLTALTNDPQRADKFLSQATARANESVRRETTKADKQIELDRLKYQERGIRNQISDAEKNIREKGATMTPEQLRDAQYGLEGLKISLDDNIRSQASAQAMIDSVTDTMPLYEDSVSATWDSIVNDSTTALGQLRTNLNEFSITAKQQIEDAQLTLDRSKEDVIRQFNDAAIEITKTVPAEFSKMLDAILGYNSARTQAQLVYDSASGLTGDAATNTMLNAQNMAIRAAEEAADKMGASDEVRASMIAAARSSFPSKSPVVSNADSPEFKDVNAAALAQSLSKYSYKGLGALAVVVVKNDSTYLDPASNAGANNYSYDNGGNDIIINAGKR